MYGPRNFEFLGGDPISLVANARIRWVEGVATIPICFVCAAHFGNWWVHYYTTSHPTLLPGPPILWFHLQIGIQIASKLPPKEIHLY